MPRPTLRTPPWASPGCPSLPRTGHIHCPSRPGSASSWLRTAGGRRPWPPGRALQFPWALTQGPWGHGIERDLGVCPRLLSRTEEGGGLTEANCLTGLLTEHLPRSQAVTQRWVWNPIVGSAGAVLAPHTAHGDMQSSAYVLTPGLTEDKAGLAIGQMRRPATREAR